MPVLIRRLTLGSTCLQDTAIDRLIYYILRQGKVPPIRRRYGVPYTFS